MSGKRKKRTARPAKTGAVWRQTDDEATLAQNPRYNGFACATARTATASSTAQKRAAHGKRSSDKKEPLGAPSLFTWLTA